MTEQKNDDTVEVFEYWLRDPGNPFGFWDRWVECPAHGVSYGLNYPAVRHAHDWASIITKHRKSDE